MTGLDALLVGRASVALGAGRDRVEDAVDPAVGIILAKKPGDAIEKGDTLLEVHYRDRGRLDTALSLLQQAIRVGESRSAAMPLIVGEVR